jgi:conserved hypothetical protein|uniref:HdeD family acid-resistance protein n=1 Tax=Roseburia sp. TaxID=2049040 RepID=UPI003FF1555C
MREIMKKFRADMMLSALFSIVMGVILVAWPETTLDIICKAIAIILIVMGAAELVSYFWNKITYSLSGILGLVVLLIGIWIFVKPQSVLSLIPIVIGVILAVHGVQDLKVAFDTKRNGYTKWWSMLLMAIISLALGIICIVNAFGMVTLTMQIIGIALVYDGISDIWIVYKASKVAKEMKEERDALDVEYKEVD